MKEIPRKELLVLVILGLIGLGVFSFAAKYSPQAALDVQITPQQAKELAHSYLAERGHHVAGYVVGTSFFEDALALAYLQKATGPERTKAFIDQGIPIYGWEVTFAKPLSTESFVVSINPSN